MRIRITAAAAALALAGPGAAAAPPPAVVAFACDTAGTYDLYVAALDGSGLRRVTSDMRSDTAPSWSPDGRRLVFWSTLAGRSQLTVVDVADGGRTVLPVDVQPDSPHRLFAPAWSPDGRWIVFESNRDAPVAEAQTDLYLIRPDGSDLRRLTHDEALTAAPSWAADSRAVVMSRQFGAHDGTSFPELFVLRLDGREARLTVDDWHDWDATWAPRGGALAFMSNRSGAAGDTTFRIHLRRASGATVPVGAAPAGSFSSSPAWTPDGRWIVHAYDPDGPVDLSAGYFGGTDVRVQTGGPQTSRVRVIRPDGSGERDLTDGSSSCVTPDVLRRRP